MQQYDLRRKAAVTEVKLVIVGEKTESVKSSNEWSMRAREELSYLHEQLAHARAMVMDVIHKSDKKNPHSCLGCSFSHDIYDTEACLFEINGDCGPFNGYAHYKRSESVVAEANPVIVEEKTEAAKSSDGSDCPRCHGRGIFYDADNDSWFRCDHKRLPSGAWFDGQEVPKLAQETSKAIYSDCVDRAVALLASAQLREKALVEALEKAIPQLAEHLRMMRSENDPRALVATNDLADARAALDAAITAKKQIKE